MMPTESNNNNGEPSTLEVEVVNADSLEPLVEGAEGVPPGRLRPQTDLFVGIGLVLFGALAAFESWRMPRFEHLGTQPYEVPGLVPGLLGLIIGVFGLLILVRALREGGLRFSGTGARLVEVKDSVEARRLVILIAITLGYGWGLVGRIPFPVATFIFVFAFIVLFDWRDAMAHSRQIRLLFTASLQAVITAAVVTMVFQDVFQVILP